MNAAAAQAQLAALPGWDGIVALSGGRTNYVWRRGAHVHKLYRQDAASPLFANDPAVEWHVLRVLQGQGIAPEPVAQEQTALGPVLIYQHLDGPSGYANIADVARLLGMLHKLPAPAGLPEVETGDAVIAAGLSMLVGDDGCLATQVPAAPVGPVRLSLLHRDPVVTNMVDTVEGLRLIDWQCPGLGDPVEDIAHFLSPAMMMLYGGEPLAEAERTRFLQHYPDQDVVARYHAFGRAYHWRMACYCQWQINRGNADYVLPLRAEIAALEAAR